MAQQPGCKRRPGLLIRTAGSYPPRARRRRGATRLGRQVSRLAYAYSWLVGLPRQRHLDAQRLLHPLREHALLIDRLGDRYV